MMTGDTIAAISSAVGEAARMIVRASGPLASSIAQGLTRTDRFQPSEARHATLHFRSLAVPAWIYTFRAPASVTGEDVLELHIPGNPLLARLLLEEMIRLGARQAEAGEFTARSFFSGRIDLTEAEGVAATIAAQSESELGAARQLMAGELARRLRPVMDRLAETLGLVEVGIDFSEEDVTFLSADELAQRIDAIDSDLNGLLDDSARFERLSHEPRIVLVGRPNAGKSTLLNALAGQQRAVVSPVAGTTRDAIWAHAALRRGSVRIIDVAGLETGADDPISRRMRQRALEMLEQAELVVLVRDCADPSPAPPLPREPSLRIASKIDQAGAVRDGEIGVSAARNLNMDLLRDRLDQLAFGAESRSEALALNARHVRAIEEARDALKRAADRSREAGVELVALELRESLDALGRVLGSVTPDDLLTRIFSTFCIGK